MIIINQVPQKRKISKVVADATRKVSTAGDEALATDSIKIQIALIFFINITKINDLRNQRQRVKLFKQQRKR